MILTLIRYIGRSALRSKWKRLDARLSAQLSVELSHPITQQPKVRFSDNDILFKLKETWRDEPVPGYYIDRKLADEVYRMVGFAVRMPYYYPTDLVVKAFGWIGVLNTPDGTINVFRTYGESDPVPPADPPGYTQLVK